MRFVRVKPEQRKYTSNIVISYLQARHPAVTGYGVYAEETLVGYVMLIHADNPVQWIIERLTIAEEHQGKGYGYATVDQLIDQIYGYENSEMVVVRYDPDNEAARQLATKLKFEEQEKLFRKRNIALLEFEFEEIEGEDDLDDEDVPDDDEDVIDGDEEWDDEDTIDEDDDAESDKDNKWLDSKSTVAQMNCNRI